MSFNASKASCRGAWLLATAVVLVAPLSASAQFVAPETSRLRAGVEGGAGGEWGNPRGASLGVYGQLGVQANSLLAIYYQPSLSVHALSRSDNPDVFAAFGNLAMLDLTAGVLQVGAGGGIDIGHFASCVGNDCESGPRLVNPAVGGRIALVFRLPGVHARWGIPFALNIHSTFLEDEERVTSLVLTVGVQRY